MSALSINLSLQFVSRDKFIRFLVNWKMFRTCIISCALLGILFSMIGYGYIYDSIVVGFGSAKRELAPIKTPLWIIRSFQIFVVLILTFQIMLAIGMILHIRKALILFCINLCLKQACFFGSAFLWSLPKIGQNIAEVTVTAFAPFIVPFKTGFPIWGTILLLLISKYDESLRIPRRSD